MQIISKGKINMKTIVLDIETTGLAPQGAVYKINFMDYPYIVSLAFKINDEETKYFIINQEGREIPSEAIAIHGITNEMCQESQHFLGSILEMMISEAIGADISIGHNIYYDISTIKANVLRMIEEGKATQSFYDTIEILLHKDRRIDTMKQTTKFCNLPGPRGAKWPKLTELYFILFNENFNAHNSKDDVDATYRCYLRLKELGVI